MCGVCGLIRPSRTIDEDRALVATLNERQRHRGPDGAGIWRGERAVLGQTRLAIVDLTDGGRQPFVSVDGSVSVVFNGEIYNHEELRRRYRLVTASRCDGAILPELWTRLGTSMFRELRGMYAIAVFDVRAGTVTLARDPFGIKPLYWTQTSDGALAFASEPRPLLAQVPHPRLSRVAVHHYLMFGALGRDQSPFHDITSVAANTWAQWDESMARKEGPILSGPFDNLADATEGQLRDEFMQSVSLHLRSDVTVALLLSSGLDSAALAWACAELGTSLVCVTVDVGAGMGEWSGANRIAAQFGHHHEIVSSVPEANLVEQYFSAMQRPSIDGLNTFLVSRAVASLGVKVALSGLGADELLGGYASFRLLRYLPLLRVADTMLLARPMARLWGRKDGKFAQLLGTAGPRDAAGLGTLFRRVLLDHQIDALATWTATKGRQRRRTDHDTSALALSQTEIAGYLGGTLLPDNDSYSMACSVEMRVPYVDVPFARTALAIAPQRGVGKRRFAGIIGDAELRRISQRPKRTFTLPMDIWMRTGPLAPLVRAAQSPDAPVREILRRDAVDHLISAWRNGQLGWSRAWSVVSLDAWLRTLGVDITMPDARSTNEIGSITRV